jgi:PPK2 family polyphosphate:nucleotide phosphotransferase
MVMGTKQRADTSLPNRLTDQLRVAHGPVDLAGIDPRSTPGFSAGKSSGKAAMADIAPQLADLQEQLFAEGRTGGGRSLLLALQGMDTSGKGGTLRHVIGQVDPQGVAITAFKAPTKEELSHDFLWRIRKRLPEPGMIGAFDRSHYEDVVVARVHDLVPRRVWSRRYATINRFEDKLVAGGTKLVKVFLHISPDESKERLLARLDDPTKHWKFTARDVDERAHWLNYQQAYADALERCTSDVAPWYVVPADRKWYRNWAVTRLLVEQLDEMGLQWPVSDLDLDAQRERLLAGP